MNVNIGFCGACVSYNSFKRFDNDYMLVFKEERPLISFKNQNDNIIKLSDNELLENDILIKELSKTELDEELSNIDYLVIDLYYDLIYCSEMINHKDIFNTWTKEVNSVFSYIKSNYPNIKFYLTKYKLFKQEYSEVATKYNLLIEKLEKYLIETYDIPFTIFSSNVDDEDNLLDNYYFQIHSKILEDQIDILENKSQDNHNLSYDNTQYSEESIKDMYNEINDFKENLYIYNKFNLLQSVKKENESLIKELNEKDEEIRQLIKFKEDVYSSLSWRITKPLRIIKKNH